MARKLLKDMTQDEILHNLQGLVRWLLDQAKAGNPEACRALSQIPEVLAKVRENRRLGRTPKLKGEKSQEVDDG